MTEAPRTRRELVGDIIADHSPSGICDMCVEKTAPGVVPAPQSEINELAQHPSFERRNGICVKCRKETVVTRGVRGWRN